MHMKMHRQKKWDLDEGSCRADLILCENSWLHAPSQNTSLVCRKNHCNIAWESICFLCGRPLSSCCLWPTTCILESTTFVVGEVWFEFLGYLILQLEQPQVHSGWGLGQNPGDQTSMHGDAFGCNHPCNTWVQAGIESAVLEVWVNI